MPLLFSDRYETRKPSQGLVRNEIPEMVRNWVQLFVQDLGEQNAYNYWLTCVSKLGIDPNLLRSEEYEKHLNTLNAKAFLRECEYDQFVDACELMIWLKLRRSSIEEMFRNELREKLLRSYSAYRVGEDGLITDQGSQVGEQAIEEARALLRNPELVGPDRQFQDALRDFHNGSSPNYEGAVTSVLNAVEGVARITLDDSSITLGLAMDKVRTERGLHPALVNSRKNLHGYASDEGGRHGLVGDPKVNRPIAEFCLHQAAASIVFIARLYGYEVVEGG